MRTWVKLKDSEVSYKNFYFLYSTKLLEFTSSIFQFILEIDTSLCPKLAEPTLTGQGNLNTIELNLLEISLERPNSFPRLFLPSYLPPGES